MYRNVTIDTTPKEMHAMRLAYEKKEKAKYALKVKHTKGGEAAIVAKAIKGIIANLKPALMPCIDPPQASLKTLSIGRCVYLGTSTFEKDENQTRFNKLDDIEHKNHYYKYRIIAEHKENWVLEYVSGNTSCRFALIEKSTGRQSASKSNPRNLWAYTKKERDFLLSKKKECDEASNAISNMPKFVRLKVSLKENNARLKAYDKARAKLDDDEKVVITF